MVATQLRGRDIRDERVLAAMSVVPREAFVDPRDRDNAYGDHPLSIGGGQTISQPYIVARMTELLAVGPGDRVLEIGTGSGYQAAVLAELGCRVTSVERNASLARDARRRLERLGYGDRIDGRGRRWQPRPGGRGAVGRDPRGRGRPADARRPPGAAGRRTPAGDPGGVAQRAGPDRGHAHTAPTSRSGPTARACSCPCWARVAGAPDGCDQPRLSGLARPACGGAAQAVARALPGPFEGRSRPAILRWP